MVQGDFGTPSNRNTIVAERWQYTPHTSDPSGTEKGDEWLRVDLDSGDKIATLRFQYTSGGDVWDIPVFPVSESTGDLVKKVLRIGTPNGGGFIPLYEQGGAYPQRAVQVNGTRHGMHDSLGAVPDSAVLQYFANTWSQGDGTWSDDANNSDMSMVGDPQDTTLSDGSESIRGDGTNDRGEITLPAELEGNALQSHSVELAVEHSISTTAHVIYGLRNDDGNQLLQVVINEDYDGNEVTGNIHVTVADDSGNQLRFGPTNNPNLDDGIRHNISIIVNDSTNNDVSIIIDGASVSTSNGIAESPSTFTTWDRDMAVWARNLGGSISWHSNIKIGAMRWHDEAIASQTIGEYPT